MPSDDRRPITILLHVGRLSYAFTVVLLFYLLFVSRSEEMYTVWDSMHPALMPTFFVATFILLAIVFSPERTEYKLLFIILHSVLCLSFSIIVLPAGVVGTPQIVLGRTRRVFDNIVLHGPWGGPSISLSLRQLYLWMRGTVLQTAFSVILARMFSVDVYWSHQLFLPLLWGVFVPIIAFKISQAIGADKKVSILSGLFASLSAGAIMSGATPVPNSFGFLFFFCSMFFAVKYLLHGGVRSLFLLMLFSLVSFLSHFLTGAVSLSFFLLAVAFRIRAHLESRSSAKAKSLLLLSFVSCIAVLPLALLLQGIFYATASASFSLDKLSGLSSADAIWLFFLGKYVDFDAEALLIQGVGPLLGLVGMVYSLSQKTDKRHSKDHFTSILFLFMGFLIILIDYRILKLFMVNIPFSAERVWVFRHFVAVPFIAIVVNGIIIFLSRMMSGHVFTEARFSLSSLFPRDRRVFIACVMILVPLSGWITATVYYAYPHSGSLQTTSYEIEAAKYIEETTNRSYVVVCDQWFTYAGQMFVGVYNPRAFYFAHTDYRLSELHISALNDPSPEPLIKAMTYNNSTVAYFVVEQPRRGEKEFERVVAQASSVLGIYAIFGEGKLYIFYYEKT